MAEDVCVICGDHLVPGKCQRFRVQALDTDDWVCGALCAYQLALKHAERLVRQKVQDGNLVVMKL